MVEPLPKAPQHGHQVLHLRTQPGGDLLRLTPRRQVIQERFDARANGGAAGWGIGWRRRTRLQVSCEVDRFWSEIKSRYRHMEFLDQYRDSLGHQYGGIGILYWENRPSSDAAEAN